MGLGFSPNGGMRDADIVLGWVSDEGKVALEVSVEPSGLVVSLTEVKVRCN